MGEKGKFPPPPSSSPFRLFLTISPPPNPPLNTCHIRRLLSDLNVLRGEHLAFLPGIQPYNSTLIHM